MLRVTLQLRYTESTDRGRRLLDVTEYEVDLLGFKEHGEWIEYLDGLSDSREGAECRIAVSDLHADDFGGYGEKILDHIREGYITLEELGFLGEVYAQTGDESERVAVLLFAAEFGSEEHMTRFWDRLAGCGPYMEFLDEWLVEENIVAPRAIDSGLVTINYDEVDTRMREGGYRFFDHPDDSDKVIAFVF